MLNSVFKKSFSAAKCKTLLRLANSRIKVLRNKREVQLKQMKQELAKLLKTNQEPSAHIRVEHIYREQNIMAAYDIIEQFCDLLAVRLPIIVSQKQCPIDLREAVGSIIFAAPRCSDVPELQELRSLFSAKYGKEFTAIAAELRPDCGVNRAVVEKLSAKGPSIEVKLKLMKAIATEQGLDWDPTALESQNLKPPEDLLDGPSRFFSASQMTVQKSFKEPSTNEPISIQKQSKSEAEDRKPVIENKDFLGEKQFIPFVRSIVEDDLSSSGSQSNPRILPMQQQSDYSSHGLSANYFSHSLSATWSHKHDDGVDSHQDLDRRMSLKGVAAAALAAAESAENAAAAARAAAMLANKKFERDEEVSSSDSDTDNDGDEVSQRHERSEDNHLDSGGVLPDDTSISRIPLFDEPVEEKGSTRLHSSGSSPFGYGKSREEQSVSYPVFSTERYNFDDTESLSHSTSLERHVSDQASHQRLDSSNSSSNNWRNQHKNSNRSFETAGAAPIFDTPGGDDLSHKPIDETAQSGPLDRPPSQGPSLGPPTLAKSTSFVHPKLPDYDDLTAHFQALKAMRSRNNGADRL